MPASLQQMYVHLRLLQFSENYRVTAPTVGTACASSHSRIGITYAPIAKRSLPRRTRITSSPSACPKTIPPSGTSPIGNPFLKSGFAVPSPCAIRHRLTVVVTYPNCNAEWASESLCGGTEPRRGELGTLKIVSGFVRMGLLSCGSHSAARQYPCSVRVFRLAHIIQGRCPVPIIRQC